MIKNTDKRKGKRKVIRIQVVLTFIVLFFCACASQTSTKISKENHEARADFYYKSKHYDKAKKELLIILKESPDDVESNFRLAVIYGKEGLIDESRSTFEKVVLIDPEYSKAYFNLGVLYSNGESADHIQKSIEYFDTFLELEPDAKQRHEIENWKKRQIKNVNERQ
jgi:tetratricopeptide (TPR) repeat protein